MKRIIALAAVVLAGCATKTPPRVSDFNGDSVKVSVYCGMMYECAKPRPEDDAEAQKTCATRQRKAQFSSTSFKTETLGTVTANVAEHLYICV